MAIKTLTDIIQNKASFDIRDLALYGTDEFGLVTPQTTQFDRYYPYVSNYINEFRMTAEQQERYKYRPDLLSYDVYGSPLFDWGILRMNSYESYSRFEPLSRIKLISPANLTTLIISLKSKDVEMMQENRIENKIY